MIYKTVLALFLSLYGICFASTVIIDGKSVDVSVVITSIGGTPTPTPVPIPPPVTSCPVVDVTWPTGLTSVGSTIQTVRGGTVISYKLPANKLLNSTSSLGKVTLYETIPGVVGTISNVPCSFPAPPVVGDSNSFRDSCTRTGADHFSPTINYDGPTGPDYGMYAICRLPAADSTNSYYITLRLPDNICAGNQCQFFLLYSPQ